MKKLAHHAYHLAARNITFTTPHGFNADYCPSYRHEQAKDAWEKMIAWFKSHGAA